MEEWLRKLMTAIGGQGGVKPTPPFVQSPSGYPGPIGQAAVPPTQPVQTAPVHTSPQVQPMLRNIDRSQGMAPPLQGSPVPAPTDVSTATGPNITPTPEQQLSDKLNQYNTIAAQNPKLAHNFKNNLLQGLFVGLQGLQRIADPQNAPQEPIKYLGQARRDYQLNQLAPVIKGLGAQVSARAEARKADLAATNTQSEIANRESERKVREYNLAHPGMETIKDEDGNILERPKGSNQAFTPAQGVPPVKKIPITLPDGRSVDVPTIDAVRFETAKAEKEADRLFQVGKINADQADEYRKELNGWTQDEEKRVEAIISQVNDGSAKGQEADSLRKQAEKIPGTKEGLEMETKAAALEAERDRLFAQARSSSARPKPKPPTQFTPPAGTVPGKKAKKKNDPYNLLN